MRFNFNLAEYLYLDFLLLDSEETAMIDYRVKDINSLDLTKFDRSNRDYSQINEQGNNE